jgi:DUF1680 family protein
MPQTKIANVSLPSSIDLQPKKINIENSELVCLEGEAKLVNEKDWKNELYREVSKYDPKPIRVRLIPYYAWGNRGHSEMSVWMPLVR